MELGMARLAGQRFSYSYIKVWVLLPPNFFVLSQYNWLSSPPSLISQVKIGGGSCGAGGRPGLDFLF